MNKIKLTFLAVIISVIGFSQSFPSEKEKFAKTLQSLTSEYLTKEQKDFIKDELQVSLVETKTFPDSYFNQMVTTCNLMESKRLKMYPDIYNYVYSVSSFVKNKQPETSFKAWHASVDKLLDAKNVKKFSDFIELSASFFSENILAESSNSAWYYYGTYVFEFTDKPFMKLTDGTLICGVKNKDRNSKKDPRFLDSVVVYNTSGVYDPVLKKWDGNGGKIDWQKVGLSGSETFVELKKYDASLKSSDLRCDSVNLTSPYFPGKKILGKLNERAFKKINPSDNIFPQFISYEKKLTIKGIRSEMDYTGGFVLDGATISGYGSPTAPATLTIAKAGKPFIVCKAQKMFFEPKRVNSTNTSVTIYLSATDTLSHPGVYFLYEEETNKCEFSRGKTGAAMAPWIDSYHNLNWYTPKVTWDRKSNKLDFPTDSRLVSPDQRIASFESANYYDGKMYDRLQGMEQVHPLVALSNYSYKYDEVVIDEGKVASALGKETSDAKIILFELASLGFISYDTDAKKVTINKKLETFVKARNGKVDYDNLSFTSDMRPKQRQNYTEEELKANPYLRKLISNDSIKNLERRQKELYGYFDLATMEIKLEAVDKVGISETQNTFVLPDKGLVTLKKNRDFDFSGWMNAGKAEIHILTGNYNYEANKVNLIQTDITTLRIKPINVEKEGTKSVAMQSSIMGITGELLVDDPTNRSGLSKTIQNFPQLKSAKSSKVYYNYKELYNSAYDSSSFYVTLEPFTLDSLDNFKEKNVKFNGELTSAGIFPVFKQEIKIMADNSFGFSSKAPAGGYIFYGTKAKYTDRIVLSNNGLQGVGTIDFVQSKSVSIDLFTFLPDSTVGLATFTNKGIEIGVQFPDVQCKEAYISYVPKQGILKAYSTPGNELEYFNKEARLKGVAFVKPTGMTATGIINLSKASLGSRNFKFKRFDIDADTCNFNLINLYKEEGESDISFGSKNVNGHVSFKDRKGEFKNVFGSSEQTFPVNQYRVKMDVFTWLMDSDEMEMYAKKEEKSDITINSDLELSGPNFFSMRADQDSLQFRAPKARYSIKGKVIYCSKTEFIDVADARIYPDSMKVTIRKKAELEPLKNAKIVANFVTKYHVFTEAEVKIFSRRGYKATGKYPYYDADSTKTIIAMDEIKVDSTFQTVAYGKIKSDDNFKLSKQFDYYGEVKIHAPNSLIYFTGATRINHSCDKFARNWMSFKAEIDPKNIQIPVTNEMKTLEGKPIAAGIVWRDSPVKDSIRLYPTFLSEMENKSDPILITSNGVLQFDPVAKEFQIGAKDKLVNRAAAGNIIALHTESCSLNGEGILNLGMEYGDVTVDAVGVVNYDQNTGITTVNTTLRMNLAMEKSPWENVAERIVAFEGSKPTDISSTTLEQALLNWSDRKTADKLIEEYTLSEDKKIKRVPDAFEKSIVITGVKLKSIPNSKDGKGLMSNLESASIVNLYGKPVMRQVVSRGFFEQIYSNNGDHFSLMMQVPGGPDYLFDYSMVKKDGTLNVITSDSELQAAINAIKEDKRKSRNFLYQISTNSVFLAKLNALYE